MAYSDFIARNALTSSILESLHSQYVTYLQSKAYEADGFIEFMYQELFIDPKGIKTELWIAQKEIVCRILTGDDQILNDDFDDELASILTKVLEQLDGFCAKTQKLRNGMIILLLLQHGIIKPKYNSSPAVILEDSPAVILEKKNLDTIWPIISISSDYEMLTVE